MNEPVSFSHVAIGRELFTYSSSSLGHHDIRDWGFQNSPSDYSSWSEGGGGSISRTGNGSSCVKGVLNGLYAAHFSKDTKSFVALKLSREDVYKDFEISFKIRTFSRDGILVAILVRKEKGLERFGRRFPHPLLISCLTEPSELSSGLPRVRSAKSEISQKWGCCGEPGDGDFGRL